MDGPKDSYGTALGPSCGQGKMLERLGRNPADYKKIPRFAIGNTIRALLFKKKAQDLGRHWATVREERIKELGLEPGMRVRWIGSENREKVSEVVRITNNWYVVLKGTKNPIRPSLIKEIILGDQ